MFVSFFLTLLKLPKSCARRGWTQI